MVRVVTLSDEQKMLIQSHTAAFDQAGKEIANAQRAQDKARADLRKLCFRVGELHEPLEIAARDRGDKYGDIELSDDGQYVVVTTKQDRK